MHPHSRIRLLGFDIFELPTDVNGQPGGYKYEPFLDFTEMRAYRSLVSGINGIWSGRFHKLASKAELEIFVVLEGNPNVISIREGYVIFPPDVVADIVEGRPIKRNRVMTIDFVVTLRPLKIGGALRYMGLSSKPRRIANSETGRRRAARERAALAQIGWDWGHVNVPESLRVANHMKLRQWAKAYPLDDAARDAAALATLLYATTSNKCLAGQLAMLGRRLGISTEDQFFVFAGAYYLGYLALDHNCKLDEDGLPTLITPARTESGRVQHGR